MVGKKFYMVKWFAGEPGSGADKAFIEIYKALKDETEIDAILVERFGHKKGTNRLKSFLSEIYINFKKNLFVFKLIKEGNDVYAGSPVGTFEYLQPPPRVPKNNVKGFQRMTPFFFGSMYRMLRFGINNLKVVIYASQYAMDNYRIKKDGCIERIVLPGILVDLPVVNIMEKEDIILTIARINRDKNLEAIGTILEKLPYAHYLIGFSDNPVYLDWLRKKLTKTIIIPNATEEQKDDLLRRAKILLHPAMYETAPVVFMEAMSYGVIPIAHKSGGAIEIVQNNFLFENAEEAKRKIEFFMHNYNAELAEGLTSVAGRFTVDRFHKDIVDAIKSM